MVTDGAFDAVGLIEFMQSIAKDVSRKVFLVMDNVKVHHGKPVREWPRGHQAECSICPVTARSSTPTNGSTQISSNMIRQLAKTLGLADWLLTLDGSVKNPGSCSMPMTLAAHADKLVGGKRVLVAGFGAGLSAAAGIVRVAL